MQTTSIIRERGQLTIPDSIRKTVNWAGPLSAVFISVIKPDEIIIRPHTQSLGLNQVWEKIRKSRAIAGKGSFSASEFLQKDRQSH